MPNYKETIGLIALALFIVGASFLISEVAIDGSFQTWLLQYVETNGG